MRIGHGYDVHRLVPGRRLILGGVDVPFELGLDGHSDADVLTHAVMDALLGAAALGDIGQHFPDTDPAYAGADSLKLLAAVREKIAPYTLGNLDATIVAEAAPGRVHPAYARKFGPHARRRRLARQRQSHDGRAPRLHRRAQRHQRPRRGAHRVTRLRPMSSRTWAFFRLDSHDSAFLHRMCGRDYREI